MTQLAFLWALKNMTYCHPDIKVGRIFGLTDNLRSSVMANGGFDVDGLLESEDSYRFGGRTYNVYLRDDNIIRKRIKVGNGTRSLDLHVECTYVDIQEKAGKYAFTDIKKNVQSYPKSACYCIRKYLCENFNASSQDECDEEASGSVSGPNHYFFPEGFVEETVHATIQVYPELFNSSDFYMGGEANAQPWASTMQEALEYILLHEFGHIEETLVNDITYGGKGDFGTQESDMDAFASSVLRCVE